MARGTECGNFNGAAPSRLTGDVRHPVGHHQRTCGTPVAMIGRHAGDYDHHGHQEVFHDGMVC